jgi:hypothetical protein
MFIGMAHEGSLQMMVKPLDNAIGCRCHAVLQVREDPVMVARVLKR